MIIAGYDVYNTLVTKLTIDPSDKAKWVYDQIRPFVQRLRKLLEITSKEVISQIQKPVKLVRNMVLYRD